MKKKTQHQYLSIFGNTFKYLGKTVAVSTSAVEKTILSPVRSIGSFFAFQSVPSAKPNKRKQRLVTLKQQIANIELKIVNQIESNAIEPMEDFSLGVIISKWNTEKEKKIIEYNHLAKDLGLKEWESKYPYKAITQSTQVTPIAFGLIPELKNDLDVNHGNRNNNVLSKIDLDMVIDGEVKLPDSREFDKDHEDLKKEIIRLQTKGNVLENQIEELRRKNNALELLCHEAKSEYNEIQKNSFGDIKKYEEEQNSLELENIKLQSENIDLKEQCEELQKRKAELESIVNLTKTKSLDVQDSSQDTKNWQEEKEICRQEIARLICERNTHKYQIEQLVKKNTDLEIHANQVEEECYQIRESFLAGKNEWENESEYYKQEIFRLQSELNSHENRIEELLKKNVELELMVNQIKTEYNKILITSFPVPINLKEEKEIYKQEITKLISEMAAYKNKIDQLQNKIIELEEIKSNKICIQDLNKINNTNTLFPVEKEKNGNGINKDTSEDFSGAYIDLSFVQHSENGECECTGKDGNAEVAVFKKLKEENLQQFISKTKFETSYQHLVFEKTINDLQHGDPFVRGSAIRKLLSLPMKEILPLLSLMADDPDDSVRILAFEALEDQKNESLYPLFINSLHDENVRIRLAALRGLYLVNAEKSIPYMKEALNDKEISVRNRAIQCLSWANAKETIPEIIQIMDDSDITLRKTAILALESFRSKLPISRFIEALNDNHPEIRACAYQALKNVTRENFPYKPNSPTSERSKDILKWESWWKMNRMKLKFT